MRLAAALHGGTSDAGADLVANAIYTTRVARAAGYSGVVAGQHFLTSPQAYLQPLPLLSRLIPESGDMRLVAGILILPLLHPLQLAEEVATVDWLSDGRLVVGVGAGYRTVEFDAFGVSRSTRRHTQLRALDELVAWWGGAEVRGTGARLGLRPAASPHPPIWLAASGPRMYQAALERGCTPFIGPQVSAAHLAALIASRPRPETLAVRRDVLITDVVGAAVAASALAARQAQYGDWGYASSPDESPYLTGSVADCRERVAQLEALGVTDLVVRTNWPEIPSEASLEMLEALRG